MKQKASKTDFTEQQLPHNRREVFFDCLKLYWRKLLWIGLLLLAFSAPYLVADAVLATVRSGLHRMLVDGVLSAPEYAGQTAWLRLIEATVNIPCYMILCIGLSGAARVIRQMLWGEPLFFAKDFADGIKQNWRTFMLCGIAWGVMSVYLAVADAGQGGLVAYLPLGVAAIIVLPTALYMMSASAVYNIKLGKNIVNSFILYVKTPFVTWLFVLLLASSVALDMIGFIAVRCISRILWIAVLLPLLMMLWQLVSYATFDRYINQQAYPEIYDKGVYRM